MAVPYAPARWPAISSTLVLWALAVAGIVFWGLRLAAPGDSLTPPAVNTGAAIAVDTQAVAQMLGAVTAKEVVVARPDAASRFVLQGVIADNDLQGVALIAVDGKPARPYRVGSTVSEGYVLQSVTTRGAALGASAGGQAAFSLVLPTRPLAVGTPPSMAGIEPVTAPR